MRGFATGVLGLFGLLLVIFGMVFAIQGTDFFMYRWFAPKYEQVRRETFEQSKAYREGMIQEMQNMQFEYVKADPEHRAALADIILHRAADFPRDALPRDLSTFIDELRREHTVITP